MECPNCKVGKLKILSSAFNPDENEAYKKRECMGCGHVFYTVEYEVIANKQFIETFTKYYNKRYYEQKLKHNERGKKYRESKRTKNK